MQAYEKWREENASIMSGGKGPSLTFAWFVVSDGRMLFANVILDCFRPVIGFRARPIVDSLMAPKTRQR